MEIDNNRVQINTLLFIAKKNNQQVNISQISDILEIDYTEVKHKLIYSDYFPMPIVDSDVILSKKWLLYDILMWALKKK